MSRATVIVALGACALAGCNTLPTRERYAEKSTVLNQSVKPRLSISSVAASDAKLNVRDFPEGVGAAYIEALAAKTKDADAFRTAVAGAIKPGKTADADQTKLSRTFAIGIGKTGYQDGQRFLTTRVIMEPVGFVFSDYTLATSKYQTVDLENVSISSETTASLDLAPKLGHVVEAVDASVSQTRRAGTSYVNQSRTESLSVYFAANRIEILQRATAAEDLTGITLLSAAVQPVTADQDVFRTVVARASLTDDAGTALPYPKASVTTVRNQMWTPRPLLVCARLDYVERLPKNNTQRFVDEGKQIIEERDGSTEPRLYLVVPPEEVAPPLWGIVDNTGGFLAIDTSTTPQALSFTSPTDASEMAYWLARNGAPAIGSRALYLPDAGGALKPLTKVAKRELSVLRLGNGQEGTAPLGTCTLHTDD